MLKNYLKIAFRTLWKDKLHAFINIFGLSIGLACCLLIMLFVRNEWSFDRFHTNADRLYRAWVLENYGENQRFYNTVTPVPLGPTMASTFPEVEQAIRYMQFTDQVRRGEVVFNETISLADPAFFEVFDFPLVRGDAARALAERNSVVLTERMATRYFGTADPVGQTLTMLSEDAMQDFVVTAVAEDVPPNSSIQFDLLLPFSVTESLMSERARQSWFNVSHETYVLLAENVAAATLEAKLPEMVTQVLGDRVEPGQYTVGIQPMPDIHLNPDFPTGIAPVSDPAYAYILFGIALLVLALACINFMTLSIGRSTSRAREVGVRKVVGAGRRQVRYQFWGEALLTSGLSLFFGIVLAEMLLPVFNTFADRTLTLTFDPATVLFLLGLLLLIGLVAGSYPAVVLARFRPADVLKGSLHVRGDRSLLRRGLVVFQFAISIMLITCTLLMGQQMRFLQTKNLGFDKEQVVVIPTEQPLEEGQRLTDLFREAVSDNPNVVAVTRASHTFGEGGWMTIGYHADDDTYRDFTLNVIDEDYVSTLSMEIIAGRDFDRAIPADRNQAILVNEALVAEYGWADPIGQHLPGSFLDHEIIGVVKDFNFASLHTAVEPLVLTLNRDIIFEGASDVNSGSTAPKISVRIRPDDLPGTLAMLKRIWETLAPDLPFRYDFLDQAVGSQYRQDERFGQMVGIATLLAILIACLGLFGLAALTVARRTKEIGVRKILGASAGGLVVLVSRDFVKLILAAFVLAAPVAYVVIDYWLQDFAYRIEISWWIFLLAGLAALGVALLTVSYQSIKAALANPVKSLRYE